MSATLTATGLAAAHGARQLFSGVDLIVAAGDVIGLVGVNGAGKTTLLNILAGRRVAESGRVTLSPPTATVGYLPQERRARVGETVIDFVARRTGVADAQREMDDAAAGLGREANLAGEVAAGEAYSVALERWLALGGADLHERAGAVAADIGLGVALEAEMSSLSGGQGARTGLLSLVASRFDIVLLDEPTNDLDLAGLARLESFVTGLRSGVVVVSHDREFLARTVNRVVELDLAQQLVRQVAGGYGVYLEEREVERRHAREAYDDYSDRRESLTQRAHRQRAWMEKGVANARRKAPDNDKIGRRFRAESSEQQAAKASQTDRLIERLEQVPEPRKEWQLRMEIAIAPRSGAIAAVARQAVVRRGAFTLGPVNLRIDWADRVAITGANGSGKTTLLGLLLGRVAPDEGHASLGSGVIVGEVDQARSLLDGGRSGVGPAAEYAGAPTGEPAGAREAGAVPLVRTMGELLPQLDDAAVRTLLAKFGLRAEHVLRPPSTLSPGERTRAALALLQAQGVNLLVLDEPTNHLDLEAIEQLEAALDSFTGTVLLVTHDRQMLATVRTTRQLQLEQGMVTEK